MCALATHRRNRHPAAPGPHYQTRGPRAKQASRPAQLPSFSALTRHRHLPGQRGYSRLELFQLARASGRCWSRHGVKLSPGSPDPGEAVDRIAVSNIQAILLAPLARANGCCEGWERSGNHPRSRPLYVALFRSPVRGCDLRHRDGDLVVGIGTHGWGSRGRRFIRHAEGAESGPCRPTSDLGAEWERRRSVRRS
jgi:hypothetical protein